ncbi:MAG: lipoyl(octanoyl) transferase LipB [Firmicutes bacterium]|nr:lipoyl(octanoyl) transferase LipB [Bacillota bacterium]
MERTLKVLNLPLTPYREAWALQHALLELRAKDEVPNALILLEHPPVITMGRRSSADHILAPRDVLAHMGIEVIEVERGGDVTFHGPGQLVGYPIVDLRAAGLGGVDLLRRIEEAIIGVLAGFGVSASTVPGLTGVWVGAQKIAAIGVGVKRGVSYHGFAMNVTTDLSYFDLIVPCGIRDRGVTSLARELPSAAGRVPAGAETPREGAASVQTGPAASTSTPAGPHEPPRSHVSVECVRPVVASTLARALGLALDPAGPVSDPSAIHPSLSPTAVRQPTRPAGPSEEAPRENA